MASGALLQRERARLPALLVRDVLGERDALAQGAHADRPALRGTAVAGRRGGGLGGERLGETGAVGAWELGGGPGLGMLALGAPALLRSRSRGGLLRCLALRCLILGYLILGCLSLRCLLLKPGQIGRRTRPASPGRGLHRVRLRRSVIGGRVLERGVVPGGLGGLDWLGESGGLRMRSTRGVRCVGCIRGTIGLGRRQREGGPPSRGSSAAARSAATASARRARRPMGCCSAAAPEASAPEEPDPAAGSAIAAPPSLRRALRPAGAEPASSTGIPWGGTVSPSALDAPVPAACSAAVTTEPCAG